MTVVIISIVVSFVTSVITSFFTFVFLNKWARKSKKNERSKEEEQNVSESVKHQKESTRPQVRTKDIPSNTQGENSDSSSKETHQSKEKKLSKKEQKLLKKKEKARRERELAEERRRRSFNPKISIPENATFSKLAVSDGHLVPCAVGQTAYYRFWEYEGHRYFEFYCDPSKEPKAFNNRSVIIDPFCLKDNSSVPVDTARTITTLEFGEIDSNYNIISKSLVKFE